ncbi:hypothetical protein [Mesorhizobium sp. WSM3868]|uniref:hypothetical protein n=1 Tax=Mesorhizobium sp. WSM3868 TaxID=2029405 RepID=UPI000BAED0F7|nr:hypothetical protein [Mesorhizobium sp. WSM3868]PBB39616.1 hypothetical protein CK221_02000 [Mesorhizobium sp. WSM3868]
MSSHQHEVSLFAPLVIMIRHLHRVNKGRSYITAWRPKNSGYSQGVTTFQAFLADRRLSATERQPEKSGRRASDQALREGCSGRCNQRTDMEALVTGNQYVDIEIETATEQ